MDWERTIDVTLFLGCCLWQAVRFRGTFHILEIGGAIFFTVS